MKPLKLRGYARGTEEFVFSTSFFLLGGKICSKIVTMNDEKLSDPDMIIIGLIAILSGIAGKIIYMNFVEYNYENIRFRITAAAFIIAVLACYIIH